MTLAERIRPPTGARSRSRSKGVTVGCRAHHHLGGDVAVGARPVVDDELLAEPFRQPKCCKTRENVRRNAGRIADDDAHRARRISVGAGDARQQRQRRSARHET
jgi:hypothetical protein